MKKYHLLLLLPILTLVLSGCIISFNADTSRDGGVLKSTNKGENWQQKVLMPTVTGTPGNFANTNITTIVFDPQDRQAVYLGTEKDGLFYTYSGGEAWFHSNQITQGKVNAIAVDPKDKCTIYVALGNSIYKSTDCSRTWQRVHFEDKLDKFVTSLVIDWFKPSIIYAGTSEGNFLKSTNSGEGWTAIKRFDKKVVNIAMSNTDSRRLYVAVDSKFIYKTTDGGTSWIELEDLVKEFTGGKNIYDIVVDVSKKLDNDILISSSKYGLLKSTDSGESWFSIRLISAPGKTRIYSLALNPQNGNEIYYGTATTFYKTTNGGQDWTTKKLSTSRAASVLAVDPADSNVIYMGTEKLEKPGLIK